MNLQNQRKESFPKLPAGQSGTDLWARELFVLSFLVFFCMKVLTFLSHGSRIFTLLTSCAKAVYAPVIFFAAGLLLGSRDSSQPDFRKKTLTKALFCILYFYFVGACREILIGHRAVFSTIKDLLSLNRIPELAAIFLSLSVLFLLCAFFMPYVDTCVRKPVLFLFVGIVGAATALIPERLLGYGPVGVLIGSDVLYAVPIAHYLFAFLAGIALTRGFFNGLFDKRILIFNGAAVLLGGFSGLLHQKNMAIVLLGMVCGYVAVLFSVLFLSFWKRLESSCQKAGRRIVTLYQAVVKKKSESRAFELLLYYAGYCILFFIMACFIFIPYVEQRTTLIWSVDGLGQYVPKIYRFMEYIPSVLKDLFSGNFDFTQYDFSSGLGATVAISYDPIYWLYLLFKPSQIELAYTLMIVLRFFLAGISMSAMLLYFKKSLFATYTVSMVYTFSGYAVYAGTKHGQFLTPLILLPILVVAMEQLISKKKWYMLTVFTALSLLCSYYFLYMNTIALGIYFVVRILCTKEYRNFKTFFTRGLIIVGSYILGACMGCITLFTSFGSYLGSNRSGGGSLSDFLSTTPLFYRLEWLSDTFISFISPSYGAGMWLKLGYAPIALLVLVLLFTRKRQKELRPLFLIFTTFCLFPIFAYIFSGFSGVNNRWCYIYAVLISFILAEYLETLPSLSGTELLIMTGITVIYGGIVFFSTKFRFSGVLASFGLLALTLVIILLLNHDKLRVPMAAGKALLFGVTMISVIMNASFFINAESDTGSHMGTYVPFGESENRMGKTALKYLDEVPGAEDNDFYRSTNLKTYGNTRSSSLVFGYNDLSTFTSTLSGGIVDYNAAMGNCDWNIVSIYSYNFRTIMHELASVRYLGTDKSSGSPLPYGYEKVFEKEEEKQTYSIYENQYALPLGYTYSSVIPSSEAENYPAVQKQEITMLSAIVDDKDMNDNSNMQTADSLPLEARKLKIKDMKLNGVTIEDDTMIIEKPGASIKLYFDGVPNAETYISLKGDITAPKDAAEHFIKTRVKAKNTGYTYKFRIDSYNTGQEEYLFHLGYHKDALSSCSLTFQKEGAIRFEDLSLYVQPMDSYAERAGALGKEALENVKTEKNTVTGTIQTSEDKLLVFSLPYQKGWSAFVDGKDVDIQKVNYQYMGINLPAGTHDIRLHYQLPGLKMAFLITISGAGVFLLIILGNYIRKRRK